MSIFWTFQKQEDVFGCKSVDALGAILIFTLKIPSHRVRLPTARLSVGETRGHAILKNGMNEWSCGVPKR